MISPSRIRIAAGAVIWIGAVLALALGLFAPEGHARSVTARLFDYALSSPARLRITLPAGSDLRTGDPVFVEDPVEFLRRVGRVRAVQDGIVTLSIDPEEEGLCREGVSARIYAVPDTVAWVVRTLVPQEKAKQIATMAVDFYREEGGTLRSALVPELERTLDQVVAFYAKELPAALSRHSDEIRDIVERQHRGVVDHELVPVLKEVGSAVAAKKLRPLAEKVSRELLDSLPVWSLGWRYLWQKVPFTDDSQVQKRFEQYLKEKAQPILAAHADEAVRLSEEAALEILKDPRVRAALKKVAKSVATDEKTQALAKTLFEELVLDNDRLKELLRRRWQNGLDDAFRIAAERAEPLVKKITNAIVLDDEGRGLSPRFSRVLRARVFLKDRRWVILRGGSGAPLAPGTVVPGEAAHE